MAYLDGQLAAEELGRVGSHVENCPECQRAVDRLSAQKTRLHSLLGALDLDGSDAMARTVERFRQRRASVAIPFPAERRTAGSKPGRSLLLHRRQLAQAALFVLFVAGGVSALVPGSPVRRLIDRGQRATQQQETPPEAPALAPLSAPQAERAAEMRVRAGPAQGSLRVALQLASGSELIVALVDGDSASVAAPVDATFRGSDGLLEATAPAGPVRVDLPRGVADVSLEVGGRLYLRVRGGQLEVTAPTLGRSSAEVSFRIP
jgi:hypothetical protein